MTDIKPSNLFLRDGRIDQVKLLDFGVARRAMGSLAVTRTGMVIGTPDYMAPEQARGESGLTAAADIFSLGCVLYECLTGQRPFAADHIAALLVRILFEDPTPVRDRNPAVPASLAALLGRMLAKEPSRRPADARVLALELQMLQDVPASGATIEQQLGSGNKGASASFGQREQDLFCVILAGPAFTIGEMISGEEATLTTGMAPLELNRRHSIELALQQVGVNGEWLLDGTLVVTVRSLSSALDQVAIAARSALLIKEHWPEVRVGLGMGRGTVHGSTPVGEAVQRVAELLRASLNSPGGEPPGLGVYVDELSARLLSRRFVLATHSSCAYLTGEKLSADEAHSLLGKPTPCVGREQELATLSAMLSGCIDLSEARVVSITAPAGGGKSRLRHEFLRRVQAREAAVTVLLGLGDMMQAGSPYGIVGNALRRLCHITGSEAPDVQRQLFLKRITQNLPPADHPRVAAFLGELCGIPFPDFDNPKLRAARQDPRLMQDSVTSVFLTFVVAECAQAPVLIVLEDLHWADWLTISLLESTLRGAKDQPFMLLTLARPEVSDLFPAPWARHSPTELSLAPLGRKACERLIQQVLGNNVPSQVMARLYAQSEGNALYLEELIRATSESKSENLPDTVLAMLQARLSRLPQGTRRLLRTASVFGEVFWRGAILALLGDIEVKDDVDRTLLQLVRDEIIQKNAQSRFPEEPEYRFRHSLMRDAAYSLLTDADRCAGHLAAGYYLERVGEPDPVILIEHYRKGHEKKRIGSLLLRAGNDSLRLCALPKARQFFAEAYEVLSQLPQSPPIRRQKTEVLLQQAFVSYRSEPTEVSLLRLKEAESLAESLLTDPESEPRDRFLLARVNDLLGRVYHLSGRTTDALHHFSLVLEVVEESGDETLLAVLWQMLGTVLLYQGQLRRARPLLHRAFSLLDLRDNDYERLQTMGVYAVTLVATGRVREGMDLHLRALTLAKQLNQPAGLAVVYLHQCISFRVCGNFPHMLSQAQMLVEQATQSEDKQLQYMGLSLRGWAESYLGQSDAALASRAAAQDLAQVLGKRLIAMDWFAAADAEIAMRAGRLQTAIELAQTAAEQSKKEGLLLGRCLAEGVWGLALGQLFPEKLEEAAAHLTTAVQLLMESEQVLLAALLRMEWAHLCQQHGDQERAQVLISQAMTQLERSGCTHLFPKASEPRG